jgi:hypothetical protein
MPVPRLLSIITASSLIGQVCLKHNSSSRNVLCAVIAYVLWQLAYKTQFVESRYTAASILDGSGLNLGQKTGFFLGGRGSRGFSKEMQ